MKENENILEEELSDTTEELVRLLLEENFKSKLHIKFLYKITLTLFIFNIITGICLVYHLGD